MNKKVFLWSIVVALGGFLFGFDTAVISGAERAIQEVWGLNVFEHGLTVSIALFGTVIGALLGGIPSDKLGRKKTLFWIAVFYFVSAVGSALATGWYAFLFFRFLGGLGVGASSVTAPLYITEISPAKSRGRLVALFQFNIVFGILIAFLSNYLIGGTGENDWRWMLGTEALPAIGFLIGVLFVPESPRWLILKKDRVQEAKETLQAANPEADVEQTVREIIASAHVDERQPAEAFFSKRYSRPITLAVLFAFFNQLSGINAIIYYAPRIFEMTGLGTSSALLSSVGVGVVNFLFTLLALNFIDRFGRRTLMFIGSVGLIVTLGLVSYAFFSQNFTGYSVPIYLFVYIAFFAFSQGAVIWVFISEIFPNKVRAYGQATGSFTHWILAALVAFVFPYIAETLGGGLTFLIFCVMMILQLLFVWRMMPETKETSLEEIGQEVVHT
ncbi:sugar porter (SP) family MFS transporter [Pontibacter ummariensis]|uniref:MFS transporter, sugar porter (SP) family n=1 Tax=Pontibacter ummariensis TaxID=1610492 RepID=A0A239GGY8_9BACT|nr:sugar porter family MFS transporter [Pontibacter ummariensis]PRY11259.1 sugar porter (SP) family MFS transporter [Pontibacter ummariensis]SNS68311.1 MFS transporter, sugar porter (SP) family [Pontibacter ummariensis]